MSQFLCSRREQASNKLFYAILIPRAVSSFNSLECITTTGGKNFIGLLAHIRVSNSYLDHTCQSGISLSSLSFIYLFVCLYISATSPPTPTTGKLNKESSRDRQQRVQWILKLLLTLILKEIFYALFISGAKLLI